MANLISMVLNCSWSYTMGKCSQYSHNCGCDAVWRPL